MDIEKNYISNKREADIFVRQLLNIGEAMYQSGEEISHIENSLHTLGKSYGATHVNVYAITSSIVITTEFGDEFSITQNRRINRRGNIDCAKMDKLDHLCRECAKEPIEVLKLKEAVLEILKEQPNIRRMYIGQIVAATMFTLFFGGNIKDAAIAGIGALIISALQRKIKPFFSAELFFNIFVSFVTGLVVNILNLIIPGIHVNQIIIGDIMVLIPGIAITNSIRYILSEDIISSFEKLMDSLMQAFGIATGFMLSLILIKGKIIDTAPNMDTIGIIIQLLAATFGTAGFCITFNLRKKHILVTTMGGFICWSVFLIMQYIGANPFASALVSSIIVGIYGVVFAKILKIHTTILFIPACLPLIPGGNLYYSARALISSDWDKFSSNIVLLILYAVGIALGLAVVVEVKKIYCRIRNKE